MDPVLTLAVIVALLIGFVAGRNFAEANRARTDMRKLWRARKDYRRSAPPKKK